MLCGDDFVALVMIMSLYALLVCRVVSVVPIILSPLTVTLHLRNILASTVSVLSILLLIDAVPLETQPTQSVLLCGLILVYPKFLAIRMLPVKSLCR